MLWHVRTSPIQLIHAHSFSCSCFPAQNQGHKAQNQEQAGHDHGNRWQSETWNQDQGWQQEAWDWDRKDHSSQDEWTNWQRTNWQNNWQQQDQDTWGWSQQQSWGWRQQPEWRRWDQEEEESWGHWKGDATLAENKEEIGSAAMTGANGEANGTDGVEDNGMVVKEEEEDDGMAVTTDVKEEIKEEEEEEEDGMVDGEEGSGGLTVGEGIGQVHNGSISDSGRDQVLINPRLPEPPELPPLHPMGHPIYQDGTFAPSTPAGRPGQEEPDSDVNMAPTNEAFPDSPVPATWFCMSVKWMKLVLIWFDE